MNKCDYSNCFNLINCSNCNSDPKEQDFFIKSKVLHKGCFYSAPLTIVICSKCGLVFINPQPTIDALKQFYKEEYYELNRKLYRLFQKVNDEKLFNYIKKVILEENFNRENELYLWLIN